MQKNVVYGVMRQEGSSEPCYDCHATKLCPALRHDETSRQNDGQACSISFLENVTSIETKKLNMCKTSVSI